jgi:hypothetical protein
MPYKQISLNDIYQVLTGHYYKSQTIQLRSISDKNQNREFKATNFPFVTFSGTFSQRKETDLIQHSGLMVLDFDHLKNVETVKLQLLKDNYLETQLLFTSPNGNGLKWIVPVSVSSNYSHGDYFDAIRSYIETTYQIEIDKSGRDVVRVCFIGYDPDAFLHPRHGKMNKLFPPEVYTIERKKFNPAKWLEKPEGKKNFEPVPLQNSLTKTQYHVEVILRRIENYQLDLTMNYDDWFHLGCAFADEFGETGRDYFHRVSRFYVDYDPDGTDKQFDECLKGRKSGIKIATFFQKAKDSGINIRV